MDKKVMKKIVTGTMAMVIGIGGLNYKNHILQKPVGLRADVIENAAAVSYSISINQATGGTIKAYKNGTDTETTGRQAGNKVDIKVYPDSGYYLSGMKYGTDSDSKLQWYYDDTTSLGFKMPEGNVTLTPIFAKIPSGADKKPENMMYAEVPVFKNGVRTSDRLYIPVEVRGVKDTYDTWTAPSYTVISKDGTKYIKDRDFTFTSVSEKDPNGIKHTMTFTGTAEPKSNDRGYVDYLANPVKGEQKITYLQHISSLSGDVTTTPAPTSKPTATPKPTATSKPTATPKPTTAPKVTATPTPAGKQYKISCASNVSHGKVSVTEYGTNGAKEQRMAKAGNYVELTVSPDEGYYLKSVKITSKKDTTTELKVSWYDDADSFGFYMPESDIDVTYSFEKTSKASTTKPKSGLYREIWEYKDGKKTGNKLYVTVDVSEAESIGEFLWGEKPTLTIVTADGITLTEGKQVTFTDTSLKEPGAYLKHTLTIKGNGQYNGEGIYKGSFETNYLVKINPEKDPPITAAPTQAPVATPTSKPVATPTTAPVATATPKPTTAPTATPKPTSTPKPTATPKPTTAPSASEDFTVTTGKIKYQGYQDYMSGKNVFCFDFTMNDNNKVKFTAAKIELEFDAAVTGYMYGADIGNKTVTIDPSNPNKVIIEFTTYDPNGVNYSLSSNLAIAADTTGDLHCTSAKVVSVSK